jgi:hypothetical protein
MNRSGLYYQPRGESAESLKPMRLIDEEYTRRPFFGGRRTMLRLHAQGYPVGRHRVRRPMGLLGFHAGHWHAACFPARRNANDGITMTGDLHCRSSVIRTFRSGPARRKLCLFACHEEHNAANERHRAKDGRQRNGVRLFACRVNWSDVDYLFPGCVATTAPRKTQQTKYHQDHPKRFVHGGLLWRR